MIENQATPMDTKTLIALAGIQRTLVICLLFFIVNLFVIFSALANESQEMEFVGNLIAFAINVTIIVSISRSLKLLGYTLGQRVLAIVLAVSCLGILVLFYVNAKITRRLREAGVKVGFFGADKSTLPRES